MRAHPKAILLAAALLVAGCSDYGLPSDRLTSPGPGAVQLPNISVRLGVGKVALLATLLADARQSNTFVKAVSGKSSDTTVAVVVNDSMVKAVGPGTATVTVTTSDSVKTPVTVSVASSTPASDSVTSGATLPGSPELPRVTVDVTMPAVSGRSIQVPAGGDLQAALNGAQPGDEVVLQAGATFTGNFTLPTKTGSGWVIVRSGGSLPSAGVRVHPSDASQMAKIVAADPTAPAISTAAGASHYRLIGLEVTVPTGATNGYTLLALGDGSNAQNTLASMAHDLVLDRMYVHGTPTFDFQRCIGLNSGSTAIVDSYVSECHSKGMDSQAIGGWNGTGPYRIENDYLEGAGENVMFGGATGAIPNTHPSDIVMRGNYVTRPTSWRGVWEVKNLFELKHAVRVLVEGNVFENNWTDAQAGYAFQWKSSAVASGAESTITSDVTFRNNIVRHSDAGFDIAAMPDGPCQLAHTFLIENNLVEDVGGDLFLLLGHGAGAAGALDGVQIVHNTVIHGSTGNAFVYMDGGPITHLSIQGNIATLGSYGIMGSGTGPGNSTLSQYAPSGVVTGNIFVGQATPSTYPAGNQFASSVAAISFVNSATGDFTVSSSSPYAGSGANMSAITAATSGVTR